MFSRRNRRIRVRACVAALAGVTLLIGAGWPSAQAAASAEPGDGRVLVGELLLPDQGTLGGFDQAPAGADQKSVQKRDLKPKWSLQQSIQAPWKRLRAPEGTTSAKDAVVIQDPTPGR